MKILVVSQYFYPENFRINELCFELVNQGHQVVVVTGYPNYPDGYIYQNYKSKDIKEELINGVEIIRVNLCQRRRNPISLMLNYLSFAWNAHRRIKKMQDNFDCVFVFEVSPITQIFPAWTYKKKCRVPVIINCQDIWPDVIKVYGIKENTLIFNLIKKLSAFLYRKGDLIITSSPGFNQYLEKVCKVTSEKITYLPNFAEDFYLNFDDKSHYYDKVHILFAGNIGKAQNLDTIIYAINKLPELEKEKIIVDILGDGSYLEELKKITNNLALERIIQFHGRRSIEEIKDYYEKADAFIITLEGNSPISLTIPSKLQGYMGAGKPILGAINGGAKDIIEQARCGKCVNAGDINNFSRIISEFIKDDLHYQELGNNGKQYFIEHFTLKNYIQQLLTIMEEIK
ncbi:MAG: glycosyltransferase family 4 protein [Beduini sp.]|uniref:glycosyltransferase family 4 protein n=1 Tax=Beduini sp. TaxID=1922300 RepID=UPI0039A113B6